MIKSFIDLVNESAEITEMGVPSVARLTGSELAEVRQFTQKLGRLLALLKATRSSDITMERSGGERKYYPRFNNPEIAQVMEEMKRDNERRLLKVVGRWKDVYPNDSDAIYMKTDAPDSYQRSHFPNDGIPIGLRGIKLGAKLYRALVRTVGYISSNRSGTMEKDNVWASMLEAKKDANGNLTEEDVHAIVGPSNWMALDKNLDQNTKLSVAMRFIKDVIHVTRTDPEQFDMDDELFQQLPEEFLSTLSDRYLRSLVREGRITEEKYNSIRESSARAEIAARERAAREAEEARERAAREAEEARERAAREERLIRKRLIARISRFGADPDADWDVGDFIVVKDYLYRPDYEPLPIRDVATYRDGQYYALNIKEMIRVQNNEIDPLQARDNRTTRDKSAWVKVNLNEIPDLDNVNLSREEKEYIEDKLSPETAARRQEEISAASQKRAQDQTAQNVDRANDLRTFGFAPSSASSIKDALLNRPNVENYRTLLKSFRDRTFYYSMPFIVLGPHQRELMRQSWAIPVYIAWTGPMRRPRNASIEDLRNGTARLTNAVSGETIQPPYTGLNLTAYPLSEVTTADKIGARAQDHFYIAGHQNVYGVIAKSQYGAVNSSRQQFIYLNVYGYAGRSVSVRLDLLRKLGAPQVI
jgi:hypothetical protein